jgi:hypothetical protein
MHELLIPAAIDTRDIAELEQALRLEAPSIQKAVCQSPPPKAATYKAKPYSPARV